MNSQLRQRTVGAPAARSVLLTVLGEFLLPAGGVAWQETLIGSLQAIGYKPQAARQALVRSIKGDWLATERVGRRSRVRLTEEAHRMLETGAERIYGFGESYDEDGTWLFAVVRVPESRRDVRHRVRTQLAWGGLGTLGGGLWISPHVDREDEVRRIAEAEPDAGLVTFRSQVGVVGDAAGLISEAWDLDNLAEQYRLFLKQFARVRPSRPMEIFKLQTLLVHGWRKFPFLDPQLPESFLPSGWPRERAAAMFESRHAAWDLDAKAYFASLEAAADGTDPAADGAGSSKSARTASK